MEGFVTLLTGAFLISLRIAPTLAFAPPFTMLRAPASIRLLLSLSLGFWIAAANARLVAELPSGLRLLPYFASELAVGVALSLALQLAFAALLVAGRAIDFQVGFGLAVLADPTLRTQMPLIGTLFAYGAGAVFFATSGPADLIAIWSLSLERIPLGAFLSANDLASIVHYVSAVFAMALGLAGLVLATLFLVDLAIAFMSRTLPQMNVLVLGFQVKVLAMLATLPFVFALSGAGFLRLVRSALDLTAGLS